MSDRKVTSDEENEYEFEDPIEAWIDLCEACRMIGEQARRNAVGAMLFKAKNSHWTHALMEAEMVQQEEDAEADYQGHDLEGTEGYSDTEIEGGLPATPPMEGGHGGTYGSEQM